MRGLFRDLRYAFRSIRSRPGASFVIVLTLTLGIGANVAIFTMVDALLLEPLDLPNAEQLVLLETTEGSARQSSSYLDIMDWREQNDVFADVAAFKSYGFTFRGDRSAERIDGALVSSSFLDVAGVRPDMGRTFTPDDEKPESERVVIGSHRFWRDRLKSDPGAIGQSLRLNGTSFTVVGVLPPGFRFPYLVGNADLWSTTALEGSNLEERGARVLHAVARLDDGVDLSTAQTDMEVIARRLAEQYPDRNADISVSVVPLHDELSGEFDRALWMILGASLVVLFIACANVASIQVAGLRRREREIALRNALGASRWRVVRQLLAESLLLSLGGGLAAVLLVKLATHALPSILSEMANYNAIEIDGTVLAFALVISMMTTVLSATVPVVSASRRRAVESLRSGARTAHGSFRGTRGVSIIVEVALSLGLLVSAGVLGTSLVNLVSIDPGFQPEDVITARLSLPRGDYPEKEQRIAFVADAVDALGRIPGIESAAFATPAPFSGSSIGSGFSIVGHPEPPSGESPAAYVSGVTPGYFGTMHIGLLKGRLFDNHDDANAPGAIIVNETAARLYWPNANPIGSRITQLGVYVDDGEPEEWTVVGVVSDVKLSRLTEDSAPQVYVPHRQQAWRWGYFTIRTSGGRDGIVDSMREVVGGLDPDVPLYHVQTLDSRIAHSVSSSRLQVMLVGAFSVLGLLLAAVGLYGLIAWEVEQTRREIGVRVALGARPGQIVAMVLRRGMTRTLIGIGLGIGLALAVSRVLATFAFEVSATSPSIYATAIGTLLLTAMVACVVPAQRALEVDPATALREE